MSAIARTLGPLSRKLALMVGRSIVRLVDDATKIQALQVDLLQGETRDQVERFQEYGFTSNPLPGAEAVAVCVAGSRDHVVVVAVDDRRFRLRSLAQGEVALYTDQGDLLHFKRGGTLLIKAATKVRIESNVEIIGNVTVSGTVNASGDVVGAGTSLHTHVHSGVTGGSSNTGGPV